MNLAGSVYTFPSYGWRPEFPVESDARLSRSIVRISGLGWQAVSDIDILRPVPATEHRSIQVYSTSLTSREQREFKRAELAIAKGLKSFLEVGMALKEIRDKRLYRQQYDTFEEYCIVRWELSRPRAYELCAASEVMTDLSANADIGLLPENEAQARPLTRLKVVEDRQRAWAMASEPLPQP